MFKQIAIEKRVLVLEMTLFNKIDPLPKTLLTTSFQPCRPSTVVLTLLRDINLALRLRYELNYET